MNTKFKVEVNKNGFFRVTFIYRHPITHRKYIKVHDLHIVASVDNIDILVKYIIKYMDLVNKKAEQIKNSTKGRNNNEKTD